MRLNLGCGNIKISDCINIDIEKSVEPDLVHDFSREELPYDTEHIQRIFHREMFLEINRVLKTQGLFYLSYPEFSKCLNNWLSNHLGKRDFWEATIYGSQRYKSDFHVCAIDSTELMGVLTESGFHNIECKPERNEQYNTVLKATKSIPYISYEELIVRDTNLLMGRSVAQSALVK